MNLISRKNYIILLKQDLSMFFIHLKPEITYLDIYCSNTNKDAEIMQKKLESNMCPAIFAKSTIQ